MALTAVTPNTTALISTADAKTHMRVIESGEDTLIDRLILAARRWIETETGRDLMDVVWDETFARFPTEAGGRLRLGRTPLSAVTSLKYYDENDTEQTWTSSEYVVHTPDHLRGSLTLAPTYVWPTVRTDRFDPITVRYTAGYGAAATDVPDEILQAAYLLVDDMYRLRGGSVGGVVTPAGIASVKSLLNHFDTGDYP